MNSCELIFKISAIANTIASKLSTDELSLLGAILSQLGDTLTTIATQRGICESLNAKSTDTSSTSNSNNSSTFKSN